MSAMKTKAAYEITAVKDLFCCQSNAATGADRCNGTLDWYNNSIVA